MSGTGTEPSAVTIIPSSGGTTALFWYYNQNWQPDYATFPIVIANDDGSAPSLVTDHPEWVTLAVSGSDASGYVGTVTAIAGVTGVANVAVVADGVQTGAWSFSNQEASLETGTFGAITVVNPNTPPAPAPTAQTTAPAAA